MIPNQLADNVATELISHTTTFSYSGRFHRRLAKAIEAQIIAAYNQGLEDGAKVADEKRDWCDVNEFPSGYQSAYSISNAIREKKIKP